MYISIYIYCILEPKKHSLFFFYVIIPSFFVKPQIINDAMNSNLT